MQSVSNNNKLIAKNTFFLYGRLIVTAIISLYISRIVLKLLGVEDYGLYNLVGGFVSLLAIFTFSISSSCQRFLVYELGKGDTQTKLSETFCTISVMLMFFSLIFFVIAGVVGIFFIEYIFNIPVGKTNIAIIAFLCSLIVFCVDLLSVPYMSLVIAHEKMDFYALVSILETVLKLVVVLLMDNIEFSRLAYYAISLVVVACIIRTVYFIYCKRCFSESRFFWTFNKEIFIEITSFTFWVGLGSFAGLLKDQGGSVLINIFFGVTLNAACGIASQVRAIASQLSNNIGLAITPQITKSFSSGNTQRSISLTFLLARAKTMLIVLVALPILIETPCILRLWLVNPPAYSIEFTRVILLLGIVQTIEMSHGTLFLAIGKVKRFEICTSIITLLVLPLTYICYLCDFPSISYYIICIFMEIFLIFYCFGFLVKAVAFPLKKFLWEVVGKMFIVSVIPVVIVLVVEKLIVIESDVFQMTINIVLCVLSYLVCVYYIGLNKYERSFVKEFLSINLKM